MRTALRGALSRALSTAAAGAVAAAGGLLVTSPPAHAVSGSCSSACIVADDISGTPDGAVFTFHTTTLSRAEVVVTDLNGANAYGVAPDVTWGSSYQLTVSDSSRFHQGNVYRYTIYATDSAGATRSYSGEFATLVRLASVHYANLHVIKDGDDIGPGDFIGDGRCGEGSAWTVLKPLEDDDLLGNLVELSDGANQGLNVDYDCPSPVGATVEPQTAVADSDLSPFDPTPTFWRATSPYDLGKWNTNWYDEGYTTAQVADPLDPTATGSVAAAFTATSPLTDTLGYLVNMRYQVAGTVTFTHAAPMVVLPPATSAAATLGVQVAPGDSADQIAVTWQANAVPALAGSIATRVQWRPQGAGAWQYTDLLDTNVSSYTIPNVLPGTHYQIAVSRVMPGSLLELYSPIDYVVPHWTTITGWPTTSVTAALGMVVPAKVQVSTGGTPRAVQVQFKPAGSTAWTTASTVQTDATGYATVQSVVKRGYVQWRLYVPATSSYTSLTSGARTLIAKTAISGFTATAVTAPTGTKLPNAVVVTPGVNRGVNLFYRKSGTATWTLQGHLITDANGKVVLPEVARAGSYQWQLVVPLDVKQGSGVLSPIRTVTGS